MMRFLKKTVFASVLSLLLVFGLVFSTTAGALSVKAADGETEGEAYQYYVFVYSGKEGTFSGGRVEKLGPFNYGDSCTVNMYSYGLAPEDGGAWDSTQTYYPRGLKLAGHDNDEISQRDYQSYTFTVTEDMSFSVAYGMRGNMVSYTVNYVEEDANGNVVQVLHDPDIYYGMPGDKPVVSYRYVENYRPNAYNLGKTLVEDESQNVFTFTYTNLSPAQTTPTQPEEGGTGTGEGGTEGTETGTTGTGTAGTGTAGTGTAGTGTAGTGTAGTGTAGTGTAGTGTGETGTTENGTGQQGTTETGTNEDNEQPTQNEPQQYIDLDEEDTPLENIELDGDEDGEKKTEDVKEEEKTQTGFDFMKILPFIIIIAAVVAFLLILFGILKKRRSRK